MHISLASADTAVSLPAAPEPKEMLSVSSLPDGRTQVRINFSSLSILQECWRKAHYSLVRGLKPKLESPATLFGSAIHKGLEVFYRGARVERHIPPKYAEVMQMIGLGVWESDWEAHLLFRAARAFVEKASPLSALPAEDKRSLVSGTYILSHYFKHYVTDPFVVYEDAAGPVTERRFSMVIHDSPELQVECFGTIDVVLRNEVTGVILGCDHKTTTMLGSHFYNRLHPNFQYTCYSLACREVLGLETDGFLVNALQVKATPKTARGEPPSFARQVTSRSEEDYQEFREAMVYWSRLFLEHSKNNFWPQTAPGPCSDYGGCSYLDLCSSPSQLRETVIKAKYHTVSTTEGDTP